eukprot:SAG31_NODE_28489_length_409_cov_1.290323_1_plen_41_part_10
MFVGAAFAVLSINLPIFIGSSDALLVHHRPSVNKSNVAIML